MVSDNFGRGDVVTTFYHLLDTIYVSVDPSLTRTQVLVALYVKIPDVNPDIGS